MDVAQGWGPTIQGIAAEQIELESGEMDQKDRTAVLVDEYPLWINATEAIVTSLNVRVCGKTSNGAEALELVEARGCDILITSVSLPGGGMDGIALTAEAMARRPSLKVIVLTNDNLEEIDAALMAGAAACVVRTAHADDLKSAIHQAFSESIFLPTRLTMRYAGPPRAAQHTPAESVDLTRRELEILLLVAEGMSNSQLARSLWVTEQTVKFHLSNIYRKLNVANRTEASRWASTHGLLADAPRVSSTSVA